MTPDDASDDLVNAAAFVPKAIRYTAFYDANENGQIDAPTEFTAIDHVLLAPALAGKVEVVEIPHDHDPRQVSDHFPIIVRLKLCATLPDSGPGRVRILSLLPNPPGDDTQNEEVTLKNGGGQPVSLVGWRLRDRAGRTWALDSLGTLQPGEVKTLRRNGQPMALNNQGDTVDLLDAAGAVVHSVSYGKVEEGELITVAE